MNVLAYAFKDLKSQRTRAAIGIIGVTISIFMLSTVSFLTDSVSSAYVDFLTYDSGNIDFNIYRRYQAELPNEDYWMNYTDIIQKIESATDKIEGYIPRANFWYSANSSNDEFYTYFEFVGLNVSYEEEIGFGNFKNTDYDFATYGIPRGNCAISIELAETLDITTGDTINITRWRENGQAVPGYYMNLTVIAVFDVNLKFPSYMSDYKVLVDIADINYDLALGGNWENLEGRANNIYLTLKEPSLMYDIRDISGSEVAMEEIGAEIQFALGYGYWVDMPKLEMLGYAEFVSVGTSILFIFIGLISMLIAGILINGILSTSVEERIREFGIFRCLGAHKSFNLKLVIYQSLLLCVIGTTLGLILSSLFTSKLLIPLALNFAGEYVDEYLGGAGIAFVAQPSSVIVSYVIGIGVSMLVSISPAIKVMRLQIVQAINPYRHEDNLYKLIKDSSVNYKLLLFGLLLAINGSVIFFIIPRLLASLNISLIASTLIIILLVFLIGVTMAGLGLMPLLLRFWIVIFGPFTKKIMNIIKVTIFRHQRRNNSTILLFCLSFSFVMFTTSMLNIQMTQVSALIEYERGSPLVLYSSGNSLNRPTVDLQEELMQVDGIERSSAVIANPNQLTQIYSEQDKRFDAELGDYIYLKSSGISLYGIDENYVDTVYSNFIEFSQGNLESAFEQLFNGSNTCIISEALSMSLSLNKGDLIRMNFIRGDENSFENFVIVGVAEKMAGFSRFKSSGFTGNSNGVIISQENYIEYMEIPDPAWVFKIYINLRDDIDDSGEVRDEIIDTLSDDWDFYIFNTQSVVENMSETFMLVEIVLQLILSFTVIISLFGLISSSYASILERKREIGVLRALGLRKDGLGKLFTVESVIILLASGSTGTIVGYMTAFLLSENMILFTESPRLISIPWMSIIFMFSVSLIVILLGMRALLKRVKNQNLIEIFRETA